MMAKKYYWLKLMNDFFQQPKIKKLRKLAGGDTFTVIYLKMQLLSLQTDGKLYFDGVEDTFAEELALTIDEDEDNVLFVIMYLQKQGLLLQMDEREFALPETMQRIGSETDSAERMRRLREQKKTAQAITAQEIETLPASSETSRSDGEASHCSSHVRTCDTEIEKEIEKEIETDLTVSKDTVRRTDVQQVVERWNALGLSQLQDVKATTNRGKMLKTRIKEYGLEAVLATIDRVRKSSFLKGQNKNGWTVTFDWLVKPNNYIKVAEGNYDDGQGITAGGGGRGKRTEQTEIERAFSNVGTWY